MKDYIIYADSGSDITPERCEEYGVCRIPLGVVIDGKSCDDVDYAEFYKVLRGGARAVTNAANVETLTETFESTVKEGKDLIYITLSSGLSGTYGYACVAARDVNEKYPDSKIYVVDSLGASSGYGLLVWYAAKMKNEGCDIDKVYDFLTSNRLRIAHQFTVDDLMFLKRGGRVSSATAIAGSMLNIKPLLHVDDEGRLINIGKCHGRLASVKWLCNRMEESSVGADQKVFIGHGDCLDDALMLSDMIKERMGVSDVEIFYIGPTIGAHSGPGTLALFYMTKEDKER